jgi:hypothetical protein
MAPQVQQIVSTAPSQCVHVRAIDKKKEKTANEAKIIQISVGGIVRPYIKKCRQLNARIIHLKERLRQDWDVMEYADATSHLLHLD